MNDIQTALETLAEKGSPNAIAEFFAQEGIMGSKVDAYHCPVAEWLLRTTNKRVQVRSTYVEWDECDDPMATSTPVVVQMFISRFDQGFYPDLVKESTSHGW